jgi:hypothetical protein
MMRHNFGIATLWAIGPYTERSSSEPRGNFWPGAADSGGDDGAVLPVAGAPAGCGVAAWARATCTDADAADAPATPLEAEKAESEPGEIMPATFGGTG